ncbi:MAG: shikimate dehydrogenase [Actinobacteria bacterium]|nr:shikimate dehydrogenase [Actinomycetota bacterium]
MTGASAAPHGVRRAAVLGSPIAHSLSPTLHRAAYAALGLTAWRYDAVEVAEDGMAAFLAGLDASWAGLSLTMPLKRVVRPLLAAESDLARAVGAVNTVTFGPAGPVGDNTDVHGIVAALAEAWVREASTAAVLGGGATACSAVAALRDRGVRAPRVHVRSAGRSGDVVAAGERLGLDVRLAALDAADVVHAAPAVVVSTLPAGAADALADDLAAGLVAPAVRDGAPPPVLLDVVYAPWPTALARAWTGAGGPVVSGLAMLLHQAAEQVRLMTGLEPPVPAMRAAVEAEVARR